jgi:oligosaccharide repeat unit polymerase
MRRLPPELLAASLLGLVVAVIAIPLASLPTSIWLAVGSLPVAYALLRPVVPVFDPRRFSIPSFWFLTYVSVMFLPSFWVYADHQDAVGRTYLLGVTVGLLGVTLGIRLAAAFLKSRREEIDRFFRAEVVVKDDIHSRTAFALLVAVVAGLSIGYIIEAPVLPLLYLLRHPGSGAELVLMREESFKLLDSPFRYAYDVVRRVAYPFIIAFAFAMWRGTRRPGWRRTAMLLLIVGSVFVGLSGAKAPVAFLFLVLMFTYMLLRERPLPLSWLVAGGAIFMSFPLLVLELSTAASGVSAGLLLNALLYRMFYLPAEILYYYFEIYPAQQPFLHGGTIGRLSALLGRPEFDVSNYVFRYMYPGGLESGSATTAFVGALHADFGLPGIIVGSVLAGVLMQVIQAALVRREKTPYTVALYGFLTFAFFLINVEPLTQALLSGGVSIVLALTLAMVASEHFVSTATIRSASPRT